MNKRKLGRQGLQTSAIGLGCMGMSFAYGKPDAAECARTLHRALELGIDFLDTAEIYGPWTNEELLGRELAGKRDKVVIATKFAFRIGPNGERLGLDSSPENVRRAVEGSLKRLKTDRIDLLYQHRLDPKTPIEETVGAMADLVKQGKIRFLGLSEVGAATIRKAHATHPISAIQSEYSLWETTVEERVLPVLRELGIGFVPYSPVGRGFLTGRIKSPDDFGPDDFRRISPRFTPENFAKNLKLVEDVKKIAAANKATPAQIALAWLLQRGEDMVPIPGTTRVEHLEENVGAVALNLPAKTWAEIDALLKSFQVSGTRYPAEMMKMVEAD
jgi:aryl-alcohol dehydrogenase-like predicted oxidoreductase